MTYVVPELKFIGGDDFVVSIPADADPSISLVEILRCVSAAYEEAGIGGRATSETKLELLELAAQGQAHKLVFRAIVDACRHARSLPVADS